MQIFFSEPRATLASSLDDSHSFGRKSCHASRKTLTTIHDVDTKVVFFEENYSKKLIEKNTQRKQVEHMTLEILNWTAFYSYQSELNGVQSSRQIHIDE